MVYLFCMLGEALRYTERREDEMTITDSAVKPGTSSLPKLLYTRSETAEMFSLSVRTVDSLIATKQLRVLRIGRSVRIPLDAIRAVLEHDLATDKELVQ